MYLEKSGRETNGIFSGKNSSCVTDLWWKYLGCQGEAVGINRFGFSAPGTQVLEELGMNVDNVVAAVHKVLAR